MTDEGALYGGVGLAAGRYEKVERWSGVSVSLPPIKRSVRAGEADDTSSLGRPLQRSARKRDYVSTQSRAPSAM